MAKFVLNSMEQYNECQQYLLRLPDVCERFEIATFTWRPIREKSPMCNDEEIMCKSSS